MSDDLVERVARAMWEADGADFKDLWSDDLRCYEEQARAAIALVLEEAARVAEGFPAPIHGNLNPHPYAAAEQTADEIAAAIRAMVKE